MNISDILNVPLGWLINVCYNVFNNYLFALLLFAIIIKLLLLPLGIKQHNNAIKQAKMRPKEQAIVKKYANRTERGAQQKKQEEIQRLYESQGYSQFAGCLPMLIQLPIILCIYNVVRSPLRYICGFSTEVVNKILEIAGTQDQIIALKAMESNFAAYSGIDASVAELNGELPNFMAIGLDLSQTPQFGIDILIIIPLITFVAVFVSSKLTRKLSYQSPQMQQATPDVKLSMTIMDFVLPLLSTVITFSVPAVIGVYWIYQNLLGLLQQFILVKVKPFPVFTEEDYKTAEREIMGKKNKKNKLEKKDPDRPRLRSLHHIDDEEYNAKVVETQEKTDTVKSDLIAPVKLKDYSEKPKD